MHLNAHNLQRLNSPNRGQSPDTSANTKKHGAYLIQQTPLLQQEITAPIPLKPTPKSTHQKALNSMFGSTMSNPSNLKNIGDWVHFGVHYGEAKAEKYEKKSTSILASKSENIAIAADAREFSQAMIQVSSALNEGQPFLAKEAMSKFTSHDMTTKINTSKLPAKHREMLHEINEICLSLTEAIDDTRQTEAPTRESLLETREVSRLRLFEQIHADPEQQSPIQNKPANPKKSDQHSDDNSTISDLTDDFDD